MKADISLLICPQQDNDMRDHLSHFPCLMLIFLSEVHPFMVLFGTVLEMCGGRVKNHGVDDRSEHNYDWYVGMRNSFHIALHNTLYPVER